MCQWTTIPLSAIWFVTHSIGSACRIIKLRIIGKQPCPMGGTAPFPFTCMIYSQILLILSRSCSEVLLDRGVTERILSLNERPWEIMKQLGKDSIRQMELMRFYLQHKQDPHGPNIALFIGNLPQALSQRNYEQIITKHTTEENKYSSIGPIYYEYGSVVITFENAAKAVRAFYNLRESIVEDKKLQVLLLPNIEPSMVPAGVQPLLVFVNVKSGGCQGLELISSFRKLLNPYQVFDLDNGGPLPGLYVFRHIQDYKILVCGGDGTIGWVLQCLDNVGQDSECSSPPCAIVPLGTGKIAKTSKCAQVLMQFSYAGNDLARVLRWGPGYTGGEDPLNLLRDVIDAEEIRLDRWTVVFHPEDKPEDAAQKAPSNATGKKKKVHQAQPSPPNQHQTAAITSNQTQGHLMSKKFTHTLISKKQKLKTQNSNIFYSYHSYIRIVCNTFLGIHFPHGHFVHIPYVSTRLVIPITLENIRKCQTHNLYLVFNTRSGFFYLPNCFRHSTHSRACCVCPITATTSMFSITFCFSVAKLAFQGVQI